MMEDKDNNIHNTRTESIQSQMTNFDVMTDIKS